MFEEDDLYVTTTQIAKRLYLCTETILARAKKLELPVRYKGKGINNKRLFTIDEFKKIEDYRRNFIKTFSFTDQEKLVSLYHSLDINSYNSLVFHSGFRYEKVKSIMDAYFRNEKTIVVHSKINGYKTV